jgi:hypothetical protein
MKFNNYVTKILEDFNTFPQHQTAPSVGPDQGMTTGDMNNTFPNRNEMIFGELLKRKKRKKRKFKLKEK